MGICVGLFTAISPLCRLFPVFLPVRPFCPCPQNLDVLRPSASRSVAQPGSALVWGTRGRRFESGRSDHQFTIDFSGFLIWLPIVGLSEVRFPLARKHIVSTLGAFGLDKTRFRPRQMSDPRLDRLLLRELAGLFNPVSVPRMAPTDCTLSRSSYKWRRF